MWKTILSPSCAEIGTSANINTLSLLSLTTLDHGRRQCDCDQAMNSAPVQFLFLMFAGWVNREQQAVIDYLLEERKSMLEQIGGKTKLRFTDAQRTRLAAKAKLLRRKVLRQLGTLVTPDTLQRWYKRLIAKKYDGTKNRGVGRPKTCQTIESLVVTMALNNDGWGYTRIVGALWQVGHYISRNTVKRILKDKGIEPAPHRGMSWKTFLKTHWGRDSRL